MPSTESIPTIVMANAGPLTTTWTAPESCSTASNTILGWEIDNRVQAQWAFDCDSYEKDVARFYACVPSSKEISETLVSWTEAPTPTVGGLFYYSPGIDCPQGWTTAGVAAKNADGELSTSGTLYEEDVFSTTTKAPPINPIQRKFADALDNEETAVVCCPSDYTANKVNGECYSGIPASEITATEVCRHIYLNSFDMDSYTYTYKSEVITNEFGGSLVGATATVSTISVYLPTSEIGGPKLTPIAVMPAVTLVRKEGDEEDAASLNRNGVGVMAVAWSLAAVLGAAFLA